MISCDTCKYRDIYVFDEPCYTCSDIAIEHPEADHTMWEPIEDEEDDDGNV